MDNLEQDLDRELKRDLDQPIPPHLLTATEDRRLSPGRRERLTALSNAERQPDTASDQLAQACAGLLMVEQEFRQLAADIVGDLSHPAEDTTPPSDKGPILPRLRSDAELLARLAIRLKKLVDEVRGKL